MEKPGHHKSNLIAGRHAIDRACQRPQIALLALGLSTASPQTLLRGPGPLGVWALTDKAQAKRTEDRQVQMQTAIITAGLLLGFVVKSANGFEVRQ